MKTIVENEHRRGRYAWRNKNHQYTYEKIFFYRSSLQKRCNVNTTNDQQYSGLTFLKFVS